MRTDFGLGIVTHGLSCHAFCLPFAAPQLKGAAIEAAPQLKQRRN
jgi:hypothetical protein